MPVRSDSHQLIVRLLDLPDPGAVVRELDPKVLHQVIRKCGLEDAGDIVALATPDQLLRVFDEDLWGSARAGAEDWFDADRFGLWLEVLTEMGEAIAADKLAALDFDFVTAAFSRHILVLDRVWLSRAVSRQFADEGDHDPSGNDILTSIEGLLEGSLNHEFGDYVVISKRPACWEPLLAALISLDERHSEVFARLMDRCCRISVEDMDGADGLCTVASAGEQVMSDAAHERELRREAEGYVTAAMAAAFLEMARQLRPDEHAGPPERDHITSACLRATELRERGSARGRETAGSGATRDGERSNATEHEVADFISVLREAGAVPGVAAPQLCDGAGKHRDRLFPIKSLLSTVGANDPAVYALRMKELGFLANVLMAGCSFQSRRFTAAEAADAVIATCNLGVENWPSHWKPEAGSADLLARTDLVGLFKIGWTILYDRVCIHAARRLAAALADLRCGDRAICREITALLTRLRYEIGRGTPWNERDNLDVLAILDQPTWSILLGFLDECPVVPAFADGTTVGALPRRLAPAFSFFAEEQQVTWARKFSDELPDRLLGSGGARTSRATWSCRTRSSA